MTTTEAVLADALALPTEERARLASRLLDSLDEQHDPDADALWGAEIARRVQQVHAGTAVTMSAEECVRQAYAHLAARRG